MFYNTLNCETKTQYWSLWFGKCTWLDAQVCWAFGNNQHNLQDESGDDVGFDDDNDDEQLNSVSFSCMVSVLSGREQILLQVENISPSLSLLLVACFPQFVF